MSMRRNAGRRKNWNILNGPKNKGGRSRPLAPKKRAGRSALRKLEARAGFLVAIFLAFDDARIAGQEAFLLEGRAQIGLVIGQGLGKAVAHRAGLSRQSAPRDRDHQVVLGEPASDDERLN